jgi:hypothetical protein
VVRGGLGLTFLLGIKIADLQGAFFWLLARRDRTPGDYYHHPGDGVTDATNEYIHPISRIRKGKVLNWNPLSLKGYALGEPDGSGAGWRWGKGVCGLCRSM